MKNEEVKVKHGMIGFAAGIVLMGLAVIAGTIIGGKLGK